MLMNYKACWFRRKDVLSSKLVVSKLQVANVVANKGAGKQKKGKGMKRGPSPSKNEPGP